MATVALSLGSSPTSTSSILETKSGVLQSILLNPFTVLIHFTNSVFWWIKDKFLFFGYQFLGMCLHLSTFQLIQFVFYKLPIPIIVSFLAVFLLYIKAQQVKSWSISTSRQETKKKGHLTWSAIYPVILPDHELFRYGLKFLLNRLKEGNKIVFQLPIN